MSEKKTLPNYLHVFEQRLSSLHGKLQEHLDLPKDQRNKKHIVPMIKEAKKIKKLIEEVKNEHSLSCPHCGKKI